MGGTVDRSIRNAAWVCTLALLLPHPGAAQDQGPAFQRQIQKIIAAGRLEEALHEVERFLGKNPGSTGALVLKGNLLLRLDRPADALEAYQAAADADGGGPAWAGLALALHALGRPAEAVGAAARALEHGELRAGLLRLGGVALLQEGRPSAALAWLAAARLLAPDDPEAHALYSRALLEAGRADEALLVAAEAVSLLGMKSILVRAQAAACLAAGQEGEAADLLALLHRLGQATPEERAALGDLLLRQGEPEAALRLYAEAEAGGISGPEHTRRRALALWRAGRLEEAERLLAAQGQRRSASELVELARLRLALGRTEAARATFLEAGALEPGLPAALAGQGEAALALGDLAAAELAYRALLSREGSSLAAHLGLAEVRERQGDLRAALAELRRARAEAAADPRLLGRILRLERALLPGNR